LGCGRQPALSEQREIAALVAPYGSGKVAPPEWFDEAGLTDTDGRGAQLGYDLIETTMAP
jgi:hypothetical protein